LTPITPYKSVGPSPHIAPPRDLGRFRGRSGHSRRPVRRRAANQDEKIKLSRCACAAVVSASAARRRYLGEQTAIPHQKRRKTGHSKIDAMGQQATFRNERGPPTEAAPTFQAKIVKSVAPTKTRVHAIVVANHNVSCFMACPQAAPAHSVNYTKGISSQN
jgi:hypothetical protein